MSSNGDGNEGLARLLGAAAARLERHFDPDVLWVRGGFVCRRLSFDTLTVEHDDGTVLEQSIAGVDVGLLR